MNENPDINEFSHFEAMDRSWVVIDLLHNILGEHPVLESDEKAKKLYEEAQEKLGDLYQRLGNLLE